MDKWKINSLVLLNDLSLRITTAWHRAETWRFLGPTYDPRHPGLRRSYVERGGYLVLLAKRKER
jgi:hypothetical protein